MNQSCFCASLEKNLKTAILRGVRLETRNIFPAFKNLSYTATRSLIKNTSLITNVTFANVSFVNLKCISRLKYARRRNEMSDHIFERKFARIVYIVKSCALDCSKFPFNHKL